MIPKIESFYQHRYGGLYIVNDVATHTGTKERLVIYTHLYPFESGVWARPISEWTEDRFTEITGSQLISLQQRDREEFQKEITETRTKAKQ